LFDRRLRDQLSAPGVEHTDRIGGNTGRRVRRIRVPAREQGTGSNGSSHDHQRKRHHQSQALPPTARNHTTRLLLWLRRHRPERRELARQPLHHQLVEPHGPVEILQPLLAQVAQLDPRRLLLLVLQQLTRGLRDKHLAAMCRRADPRRPVHGETVVATVARLRLACVDPHPHAHLDALVWPRIRMESALRCSRRVNRILRPPERGEERIPLRVHDLAAMRSEDGTQKLLMLGQQPPVPVPQLLEQPRRALDVREQEGDRAARQLSHGRDGA
jgi:hypothetical protein